MRRHRAHECERERLVEDQAGVVRILAADRLRDQRHRAYAQRLGQRHDDEHGDARGPDARESGVAQLRDEVQIDQEIEGLRQHPGRDRRGHGHEMPGDRPLRQVAHGEA